MFHGVIGRDLREGNSPSWFNQEEIDVVVKYIQKLLKTEKEEDIAVITPYKK
mgnify:CR=1 FL=1